ncbi:MAG: ribonuclease PH [Proteobacteria bacterium]|nr:ribonuclease PH [Pseudomonadota bacterium]
MKRADGRAPEQLRSARLETGFQRFPEGSVLYTCGGTRVLIAASVEEGVKEFLRGSGRGWVTAEYAMHPRASQQRQRRESRNQLGGRSHEIQRFVGRSLRGVLVREKLGERQVSIDCDVLDADGGTRTAAVSGGFVALSLALEGLRRRGVVGAGVLREPVAAISVGIVHGEPMLDLCYTEDRDAQIDLNLVGTESGRLIELQGTAEGAPIDRIDLDGLVELASQAIPKLAQLQREVLDKAGVDLGKLLA